MGIPVLETSRLIMRPWSLDDIDALHTMWTTAEMSRVLWDREVIPREQAAAMVRKCVGSADQHGVGLWCLLRKPGNHLAGFCGFRFIDDADIELLYGLLTEYQGQGLATEAARAALAHGFDTGLFTTVYARADRGNLASVRVMERLGMTFVRETHAGALPTLIYSLERR